MIRTIMVPLDGSALAEAALPHAGLLAAQTQGTVLLVRVADAGPRPGDQAAAHAEAEVYLGHVQRHLGATGFTVRTLVASGPPSATLTDSPAEALVSIAAQQGTDLISMSTHGRAGLNRLVHGSVAAAVLHATPLPVLLVSPAHRPPVQLGAYRRLLVPLDGTPLAEGALRFIVRHGFAPAAHIFLVRAVAPSLVYAPAPLGDTPTQILWQEGQEIDRQINAAQAYLHDVARSHPSQPIEALNVTLDEPAAAILGAAQAQDVDAIVMATRARGGRKGLLEGSVAAEVLYRTAVPVVLLRGDGAA